MDMEMFFDVSLRLPAADRTYTLRIPAGLNTHVAALLAAQALEPLSDGAFRAAKSCLLAWQGSGRILEGQKTIRQNGVRNGSKLLLI